MIIQDYSIINVKTYNLHVYSWSGVYLVAFAIYLYNKICADYINRPKSYRTNSKSVSFSTNLPEMPVLLGSEDGKIPRLAKTVTLAMFAYDKDCNLSGKETQEKEVYYDLYIQRIQDKNGAILKNQPLVKVLSNVKENSVGEGITFTFDSTKYEDGYYRFIGLARNMHDTYFLQDKPSNSITASGNYNGTDLYSGYHSRWYSGKFGIPQQQII